MRLALDIGREIVRLPELEGFDSVCAMARVERAWLDARHMLLADQAARAYEGMAPELRASLRAAHERISRP